MQHKWLFTRVLGLVLALVNTVAIAANDMEGLQGLLDAGQSQQAFVAATTMLPGYEGDSSFDFLYGKAAYLSGHYHEAMFALERILYAEPEDIRARYLLAKTYHAMGNYEAARREFRIVQANNPPADIAEDTSQYLLSLQKTDKKSSLIRQVEVLVGHDDNINRATGDNVVDFPLVSLPVLASARQQSDAYRQVGGNIHFYQPLRENLGVILKGDVTDKDFFSSDDFDETIYSGSATLNKQKDKDTLKLGVNTQSYQVSGSTYSINRSVAASWYRENDQGHGVSAGLNLGENDYPGNSLFNVEQRALHAGIHRRYGSHYHAISFMLTDEEAEKSTADYNARNTRYWFYDFNAYLDARNSIQSRILYSETWRNEQDPVFFVNRDDDFLSLTLSWQWRYNPSLMAITRLGVSDNDSDVKVYEYERQYIETGIRYTF